MKNRIFQLLASIWLVRSRAILACAILAYAILAPGAATANTPAMIRITAGDHAYYGRLVLNAPGLNYTVSRDGSHVLIAFPEDVLFGELPPAPRNVLAMRTVPGGVELTVPPGTEVRTSRIGDKIIVDIDDMVPNRSATPRDQARWTSKRAQREALAKSAEAVVVPAQSAPSKTVFVQASGTPPTLGVPDPRSSENTVTVVRRGEVLPLPPANLTTARSSPPELKAVAKEPITITAPADIRPSPEKPASDKVAAAPEEVATRPAPTQAGADVLPRTPRETGMTPTVQPASEQTVATPKGRPEGQTDAAPPAQPDPMQVWPVTRDPIVSGPVALVAAKARPPGGLSGAAVQIPFAAPVGAAMFSRGPDSFVVFDERRPIDLAALRDDPVFGSAVVTIFPEATVIRVTRPPGRSAILSPAQTGWRLSIVSASPRPAALTPVAANDVMTFAANAPGQVVAITDPQTGGTIMIGTQRASGQGVLIERRTAEFMPPSQVRASSSSRCQMRSACA